MPSNTLHLLFLYNMSINIFANPPNYICARDYAPAHSSKRSAQLSQYASSISLLPLLT